MIVYVPGRMPRTAYRLGVPYQLLVHQQQQQQHYQATAPPSPPISPTTTSLFNGWPRTMPQDEEMLVQSAATAATIVVNGPSSPAHSDSDASNSSLELRTEHTQLQCRWLNCSRWFTSLKQLADHVGKMHSEPGPKGLFYCGWDGCQRGDRGFNARYKMLVHVRTHTNEKPHRCFQCSKSFSRAENLKIHARSHTGERPYVCPVEGCNKAYSNSSDRFKHSRTHAVDKPYACKIAGCPKRYTDPSSLRKHIKTYRHCVNNNNDNNKHQDKTHNNTLSTVVPKRIQHHSTPDKRSTTSPSSDSDKKNSSLESNTTSTSLCSISESPKTTSSTSFEEQQKLVEWNNMYNLQEHHRKESNISITSSLKISNLEHHQHQQQQQQQQQRLFTRSPYEEYILPDHHLPVMKAPTPSYPIEMKPHLATTASPPDHPMAAIPRIGTQSTPIKSEDKAASGVDYRNIDSIVNSSNNSTPLKKEPASSTQLSSPSSYIAATTDIVRNSVIKRADAPMDHQPSTISQQESPTTTTTTMNTPVVKEECCCRHKCCKHAENDTLLEKTKILSELILNSPNPVFRHLLASMELHQYGLQNSWSSSTNNQQIENSSPNTCAQDLRAKSTEAMQIDMDQDLPLDLTINK